MSLRLAAVAFDVENPLLVASFWGVILGREVGGREGDGPLLTGTGTQVGLRFTHSADPRSAPDRMHLHVTSTSLEDQQRTVETALSLGSRRRDVGQLPSEDHVVLSDPGGNDFCVIGPGNRFLAGCGRLGEVGCDGTRAVGLFWRDALGWPLVWDQDEETAVQSPLGGTKVAWGGPPLPRKHGRNRQRFELAASDLDSQVERLHALWDHPDCRPGGPGGAR